jgi:S1-C subfamily serine protease
MEETRADEPFDQAHQADEEKMKRRSLGTCLTLIALGIAFLLGGTIGGAVGGGMVLWTAWSDPQALLGYTPPTPTLPPTLLPSPMPTVEPTPVVAATPTLPEVVARVSPAVVTVVSVQRSQDFHGATIEPKVLGSGIIVDPRGYIVTNFHVIEAMQTLDVTLPSGLQVQATLLEGNRTHDLALVKVEQEGLAVAPWGDSTDVLPGQMVLAIGSALGDFPNTVTLGVVSAVNRSLRVEDDVVIGGLIQTDAAINRGNSGGPLVNLRGEVIGINTFIIRGTTDKDLAEGIGFAIPSSDVQRVVDEWLTQYANY